MTISGKRHIKSVSNEEVKLLQLNEVSEIDKAAIAERKKSESSQKGELNSESGILLFWNWL